jgi:hypothetical protein
MPQAAAGGPKISGIFRRFVKNCLRCWRSSEGLAVWGVRRQKVPFGYLPKLLLLREGPADAGSGRGPRVDQS